MKDSDLLISRIKKNGSFYEVSREEIEQAEKEMKLKIPKELVEFYEQIGYGFFNSAENNVNRIMDPLSIRDFRMRKNTYRFLLEGEIYKAFEKERLFFFEVDESAIFSLGISVEESGVFWYDVKIAASLNDFLERFLNDENYYLNLL